MNIFKKLLKIGQAEIHAWVEKMEDPITLTQQGIADLKVQLIETKERYAQSRALVIRTENEIKAKQTEVKAYEEKALRLLEKAKNNELEQSKAENLAMEALRLKKQILDESEHLKLRLQTDSNKTEEINKNIDVLNFNISKWEKELTSLRAKQHINNAASFVNMQIANLDSNSTIEMLERLKSKAEQEEAMGDTYNEIAKQKVDKDIDFALSNVQQEIQQELNELKRQIKND